MRNIILINSIIELFGGICVILYPEFLIMGGTMDNLSLNIGKMYGMAAATFGFVSYLVYRFGQSAILIKYFALLILAFHLVLTLHLHAMYRTGIIAHSGPFYFHLATGILFIFLYLRKI